MDKRDILAKRTRLRMIELDIDQGALAARIKVSQPTISNLLNARFQKMPDVIALANALNTTPDYLLGKVKDSTIPLPVTLSEKENGDTVTIPELDIGYSMGGGAVMVEPEHGAWHGFGERRAASGGDPDNDDDSITLDAPHNAQMRTFPRAWLEPLIKGRVDQVFIARGEGDSMQPTLLDGDVVLIDRAQNSVTQQDRLWAIGYGELVMIKRVRRLPDGGYQINSDNPAVTAITAYDDEMHIVGRVVWIGRKM